MLSVINLEADSEAEIEFSTEADTEADANAANYPALCATWVKQGCPVRKAGPRSMGVVA